MTSTIILAAGFGSRLRPLTESKPKCLLEVNGKPLLDHALEALRSKNLSRVIIVTGHLHNKIEEHLKGLYPSLEIELVTNERFATTNNAYSLGLALQKNGDDFILMDGDLLFDPQLLDLLLTEENGMIVDSSKTDQESMKVEIQNRAIKRLSKNLNPEISSGEYIGLARFGKKWTTALTHWSLNLSLVQENLYYEDGINSLIPTLPSLIPLSTSGLSWCEIDTLEDYQKAIISI